MRRCLITDLDIVAAAVHDSQAVAAIQQRLQACELLPETHLADAGYVNGLTIQSSLGFRSKSAGTDFRRYFGGIPQRHDLPL